MLDFWKWSHRFTALVNPTCEVAATQKAVSEAFERTIYLNCKGGEHGTDTSNGWACHFSEENVKENALEELLERDALLVHWLKKSPFLELDPNEFPQWLEKWIKQELTHSSYPLLRVLVSHEGYRSTSIVILSNDSGKGVIAHAAKSNLHQSIAHAIAEACRIADSDKSDLSRARSLSTRDETIIYTPMDHSKLYSNVRPLPEWVVNTSPIKMKECLNLWKSKEKVNIQFSV